MQSRRRACENLHREKSLLSSSSRQIVIVIAPSSCCLGLRSQHAQFHAWNTTCDGAPNSLHVSDPRSETSGRPAFTPCLRTTH
eukprot:5615248-Pleurochrysis_carterae.AAC.3